MAPRRDVRPIWLAVCLVTILVLLAGCLGDVGPNGTDSGKDDRNVTEVGGSMTTWPPRNASYATSGPHSSTLHEGRFPVTEPETVSFRSHDGTNITGVLWRPDVPDGTQVPVVLRYTPYCFDSMSAEGCTFTQAVRQIWLQGIVPHGFAFAQLAVRGSGASGGCMEVLSPAAQRDVNQAVSYFANRSWSNGNVALWGQSYDGTTPWAAAQFGNPHLETILPVSGATSLYHLGYRNGTPMAIGPIFDAFYWGPYGFGYPADRREAGDITANAGCPEAARSNVAHPYTGVTGEYEGSPATGSYWDDRNFRERILENYEGSVFLTHGFRDVRVPADQQLPLASRLNQTGNAVKMILAQTPHGFLPDQGDLGDSRRVAYAERLLRWLTQELKGADGVATGPSVAVQDTQGDWRVEQRWPPTDASRAPFYLGDGTLSRSSTDPGRLPLETPGNSPYAVKRSGAGSPATEVSDAVSYEATTGTLEDPLRFAGQARLHISVVPTSPEGARLYAALVDRAPSGNETLVGHAVMDLRYHEGGTQRHHLVPGQPVVAQMQFYPEDVSIPAGHELVLQVRNGVGGNSERAPDNCSNCFLNLYVEHPTPTPVVLQWGDAKSVLELPGITRDVGEGCYPGQPDCS